jgi:hypothetical protein
LLFEGEAAHTTAPQLAREYLVDVSRRQSLVSGLPSRVDDVPYGARCVYDWNAGDSAS